VGGCGHEPDVEGVKGQVGGPGAGVWGWVVAISGRSPTGTRGQAEGSAARWGLQAGIRPGCKIRRWFQSQVCAGCRSGIGQVVWGQAGRLRIKCGVQAGGSVSEEGSGQVSRPGQSGGVKDPFQGPHSPEAKGRRAGHRAGDRSGPGTRSSRARRAAMAQKLPPPLHRPAPGVR
jgi:hypothetical protein